jgi:class 3 adenylate cyclase
MVGDAVNLASRIQDLTKKFATDILISIAAKELLMDS